MPAHNQTRQDLAATQRKSALAIHQQLLQPMQQKDSGQLNEFLAQETGDHR